MSSRETWKQSKPEPNLVAQENFRAALTEGLSVNKALYNRCEPFIQRKTVSCANLPLLSGWLRGKEAVKKEYSATDSKRFPVSSHPQQGGSNGSATDGTGSRADEVPAATAKYRFCEEGCWGRLEKCSVTEDRHRVREG